MNEVFRFLFLRPPAPGTPIAVNPSQEFAKDLSVAAGSADRKQALKAASARLMSSGRGLTKFSDLNFGAGLVAAQAALASLDDPAPDKTRDAIKHALGKTPGQLMNDGKIAGDRDRLSDNLIAAKLLSQDGGVEARQIEALLRVIDLIARLAQNDTALEAEGAISAALLKPTLVNMPAAAPVRQPPKDNPPEKQDPKTDPQKIRDRIKDLQDVVGRLSRLEPNAFAVPRTPPADPVNAQPTAVDLLRAKLIEPIQAGSLSKIEGTRIQEVATELKSVESASVPQMTALPAATRLIATGAAVEALSDNQRKVLSSLTLDITKMSVPSALTSIQTELTGLQLQLGALEGPTVMTSLIGSSVYNVTNPGMLKFDPSWLVFPDAVPTSHGSIQPVGVGDLLVVRQQLKRYEGGEVGYIENILKGELRNREVDRKTVTDQTVITEEEVTKEEERDNQSTERFELQREASEVVKDDSSFKAGLSVSGSYGPTVEFKASTDFSMDQSKEESAKTATNYSKEVTSKASSKVTERKRTETIIRTIETYKELNQHGIDNTAGDGAVIGVYQWVDKIYEAQVYNYGKRMMFDVMVPEPAAFWIYANINQPPIGAGLTKPDPFTLTPDQIAEGNYAYYVKKYQVSGVKPPPEPYQTISKTFDGTASHDDHVATKVTEIPIPDGYRSVTGSAIAAGAYWDDWKNSWSIDIALGKQFWRRNSTSYVNNYFTLDGEEGSIALGVSVYGMHSWIATVEVDCQRTDRTYRAWQLDTHAAILQGYLKLDRDYQDAVAALSVQAANQIQGRNPDENRMIERGELKKHTIAMFTAQNYDTFGAISYSPQGFPQPWFAKADAEGKYIRFFEQAFEWENMMYLFYPYFWGRKTNWVARAVMQDVDPQFAEFLKAGSARVVFPVRPGFEAALAHFMDTGEIWDGADPPTLTSPLYVSIIEEIKERTQAPGTEIEQGNPWDVRLPTTLVRLRSDGSLPEWAKQPDGTWLPAN